MLSRLPASAVLFARVSSQNNYSSLRALRYVNECHLMSLWPKESLLVLHLYLRRRHKRMNRHGMIIVKVFSELLCEGD